MPKRNHSMANCGDREIPGSQHPELGSACFSLLRFLTSVDKSRLCRGGRHAPTHTSRHGHASWTRISKTVSANPWLPKWDNSVLPAEGLAGEWTDGRSPLPIWCWYRFNQLTLSFSTWHRCWEMYLDLHPPSSPCGLLTSLFFWDLTAAIATKHRAACLGDHPSPCPPIGICLAFWALLNNREQGRDKMGWGSELDHCWRGWVFMLSAWFVSSFFFLALVKHLGSALFSLLVNWGFFMLVGVAVAWEFLSI